MIRMLSNVISDKGTLALSVKEHPTSHIQITGQIGT